MEQQAGQTAAPVNPSVTAPTSVQNIPGMPQGLTGTLSVNESTVEATCYEPEWASLGKGRRDCAWWRPADEGTHHIYTYVEERPHGRTGGSVWQLYRAEMHEATRQWELTPVNYPLEEMEPVIGFTPLTANLTPRKWEQMIRFGGILPFNPLLIGTGQVVASSFSNGLFPVTDPVAQRDAAINYKREWIKVNDPRYTLIKGEQFESGLPSPLEMNIGNAIPTVGGKDAEPSAPPAETPAPAPTNKPDADEGGAGAEPSASETPLEAAVTASVPSQAQQTEQKRGPGRPRKDTRG